MRHVRDICTANNGEAISINEIYKKLTTRNAQLSLEKDQLEEIINYYHRMQVVYMNADKEVIFI